MTTDATAESRAAMYPTACPSRYASTDGPTAGAVIACRQTGRHTIHSNLADNPADRVMWVSGNDGELIRLRCDWCRKPDATHTADEHPLPRDHADYDAFYDASDAELAALMTEPDAAPYDTDGAPATTYRRLPTHDEAAQLTRRAEQAEHQRDRYRIALDSVFAERDQARAQLADVLHDLQIAVGKDYTTAPSAAIEAARRIATAERERDEARLTLTAVKQQRDRLYKLWRQMVSEAAAVERALIRAGYQSPTGRAAELIDRLAAERDRLVESQTEQPPARPGSARDRAQEPPTWTDAVTARFGTARLANPHGTSLGDRTRRFWVWFPNNVNHNVAIDQYSPTRWEAQAGGVLGSVTWVGRTEPTDEQMRALCRLAGLLPVASARSSRSEG